MDKRRGVLQGQHKELDYAVLAGRGEMENNHEYPMRRSLRSLATGWVRWLSAIAFQAYYAFQACLRSRIQ
jgi:hypothetical protein